MKKFLNYTFYLSLLVMVFTFTSCQEEFEPLPEDDAAHEAIAATSTTAKLVENTVSNDGSFDNIVDGSSCFNVKFPYTVEVNGLEVTINSREDLELIEDIFDAIEEDEDVLEILFPVTITLADYDEIVINGIEHLRELAEECKEGGTDDDIECIDFVYPIKVYTFDLNNEETGNVVVESDEQLRRFFMNLDENDLISIDFPVTLKLYDGTEKVVDSNAELAMAIESAKEMCDEDDDNDHNDDDFTKERLDKYLVECPWLVREVERDTQLQTDQYFEYVINFMEDHTVKVKDRQGNILIGAWNTRMTDRGVMLKLEFDTLVDFTLEWFVYDIGEGRIKLYAEGGNRIIMKRACDIINDDPTTLREILKECSWIIKKVKLDGDEIKRLLGFEFKFHAEGVVTLSNGDLVSEGSWEITTNAQGRLVMAITMGDEPGVSFEWPLSDLRHDRLRFEIPDTDYELILQRDCGGDDDGDIVEIRPVILGGDWMVAKYTEGDVDETDNFGGYTFSFGEEHMLTATIGETGPSLLGSWRILRNSDGHLKVYLNLGENDPLGDLTDDWKFVSITENRIELKDISGDGTVTTLVFER